MFECDVDIESLLYRQSLFWGLVIRRGGRLGANNASITIAYSRDLLITDQRNQFLSFAHDGRFG